MRSRYFIAASLLAMLATAPALKTLAQGTPPPSAPPAGGHPTRERHPELRRALRALTRAQTDLQNAARDFGGHRAKAADLTRQAILEVQAAIKYDSR